MNGHGPVSPPHAAQEMEAPLEKGRAASDDARDFPTAAAAAGKERDACAEVAPPPKVERSPAARNATSRPDGTPRAPSEPNKGKDSEKPGLIEIPPGSEPLPAAGSGFVEALHKHVDLYLA
jgi:hypothetical protein